MAKDDDRIRASLLLTSEVRPASRMVIRWPSASEVSKSEALILSLVTRAIKGDSRATAQVLAMMLDQGKSPQGEERIVVNVIDKFDHSE
jgi:hypothetical protein